MKLFTYITILCLCTVLCCGCPYESPYAIEEIPQENIDEKLLGKWAAFVTKPSDDKHFKEDPVKLIFEKRSDLEYNIAITGYIDDLKPYKVIVNDSIKGTAFIATIGKQRFLNTNIYGRIYIAELKITNNGISILSLAEHFTAKYIKSSIALKTAIEFHYRTRTMPIYDDWFVIKNLQKVN